MQEFSFGESSLSRITVIYRIRSDNLDPAKISTELKILPSKAYSKGEKYLGKAFDPLTKSRIEVIREHPRGAWDIISENSISSLKSVEDHVLHLLTMLEPNMEKITFYLQDQSEYSISFYIGVETNDGIANFSLSSEIVDRMAHLSHFIEYGFLSLEHEESESRDP